MSWDLTPSGRYERHALIDWFDQDAVRDSRVLVIGAGAIGNEVIKNLALLGTGFIDIVDFDRIEIHNLTRAALFRDSDVGEFKAEVAARRARELDPAITTRARVEDLWDVITFAELKRYTAVMACVDNFEARLRLNTLCRLARVDFVSTGIDSRYASVQAHPYRSATSLETTACYECDLPAGAYTTMSKRYSCGWLRKRGFVEKKVPTTIITASAAGSLAVSFAMSFGARAPDDVGPVSRRTLVDTIGGRATEVKLSRNGECFACADVVDPVTLLEVKPRAVLATLRELSADANTMLELSDPVITEFTCVNDVAHTQDFAADVLGQPASRFTDALMHCKTCADESVRVEMSQNLSLGEFATLVDSGGLPGCKFVRVPSPDGDTVVEIVIS